MKLRAFYAIALAALAPFASAQVVLNQIDTFSDLTNAFWGGGANPTVISGGGPGGATDAYLRFAGDGGPGAGGTPAITNTFQWSGDYQTAGVKWVQLHIRNFGPNPVTMRLLFIDDLGTRWTTTNANSAALPANSGWVLHRFRIDQSGFVNVVGPSTWAYTSTHVQNCLIRNNAPNPTNASTPVNAVIGVDNITAIDAISVSPSAYTVTSGLNFGGTLASLQASDNDRVFVLCDNDDSYGEVVVEGMTTFLNPSILELTVESASSRRDMSEFVDVFNFSSGTYTNVGFRVLNLFDTTIVGSITKGASVHIGAAGTIRTRIGWLPNGELVSGDGWTQRIDLVKWKLKP